MKLTLRSLLSARVLNPLADLVHTGVTLRDLLHATSSTKSNANEASVTTSFVGMNKNKGLWHITYRAFGGMKDSDPRGHLVKMRFLPDPETEDINELEVEVSCDCGAFVFWGAQYNVKQMNALERNISWEGRDGIKTLDQSAPTDNDPHPRNYVVCKHIAKVAERAAALMKRHLVTHKKVEDLKKAPPVSQKAKPKPAPVEQKEAVPGEEPQATL